MQKILILVLVLCSIVMMQAQEKINTTMILVGELKANQPKALKNPSEYMLEDGYLYKGADFRVGTLNIYSTQARDLGIWTGKIVMLRGQIKKDLNQILHKAEKAPEDYGQAESMMQLRSDWVAPETGFTIGRSTSQKLKQVSFFEFESIEEYKGFMIKKERDTIQMSFANLLSQPIPILQVTGRYESTKGKPTPHYIEHQFNQLSPQTQIMLEFSNKIAIYNKICQLEEIFLQSQSDDVIISFSQIILH